MLIKTSVVCLMFTLYMLWFYYRKPHIPIRSTRIFQLLTWVALVNVSFDLITLYTVNHRDSVPEGWNLLAHVIYLLSILGFIFLLFLYLRSYLEVKLKFSKGIRTLQSLPLIVSAFGILALPITYVNGETTDYSLGPKAYALYGSIVIYLILILYYCLRHWEILDREKRMAIVLAVPIFVIVSLIQMLFPETLLVVVASTLILLGLILSNENSEKYMDEKTALFNQYSLETVLEEFDFEKQKLYVAVICFCKTENNVDWNQAFRVLEDINKEVRQRHMNAYRIGENGVVFGGSVKEKAGSVLTEVKRAIENKYGKEDITISAKLLEEEETENKYKCMQNIIAFCTEIGQHLAYMDYLTHIYNRNAFERDLEKLGQNSVGYYIIADLNNLKVVNDTMGHSAGDELLQSFASLLENTVGNEGRAYRQGGDEFAVLYKRDAQEFVRKLEQKCKVHNMSRNLPISYAIGYCSLADSDFVNVADGMMYANKREMKKRNQEG
ncbi:MAG: GGDEF domain-containing protein [Candidatus Gastranaerophilales bacterium]|nr:GGDEF domain-containing protein [Candidatus Gastranaerophilales bacterium]